MNDLLVEDAEGIRVITFNRPDKLNAIVEAMKAALAAAGKTADFKIYPGAPHGFHADYRPSYRKEAADAAWNEMVSWFKKYQVL